MYKVNAREYQASSMNQKRWGEELIPKLGLRGDERLLDVGCGDGEITAKIAERIKSGVTVGIDNSEEMIELARKNFPNHLYPNLSFHIKDVRDIDYIKEFDVVFSNACLHWITDHLPVLQRIKRSLKPKGRILLQFGGKGNASEVTEIMILLAESKKWSRYFRDFSFPYGFYSSEEYRGWLSALDFKIKDIAMIPKDMVHEDKQKFTSWIRTTGILYTRFVPESLREELISELVEEYIAHFPTDNNGRIHISMVRLEVEANI